MTSSSDVDSESDYYDDDKLDDGRDPFYVGRRDIKDVKSFHELAFLTKKACFAESDRALRLSAQEKELNACFPNGQYRENLILDFDKSTKEPTVTVHPVLRNLLKPHQKEGIRFMWNACCETVNRVTTTPGTGCILAHCMGLGKTLQVIAFLHTLLTHKNMKIKKALVLCPKNTLLNWIHEFDKWIRSPMTKIRIFDGSRRASDKGNSAILDWHMLGGVLCMSYNAFRVLMESVPITGKRPLYDALIDPGADVIICDEGHVLKNEKTKLSKVVQGMRSARRIILTGTPVQNNLIEYYCMVNFVRPNLLGTMDEFRNRFVNPIHNGQYENSEPSDVDLMRTRSHVLYRKLSPCVQRYDYTTLAEFLPEKLEFVLSVRLTEEQVTIYEKYLSYFDDEVWSARSKGLFADHQLLQRVWTHPYSLKLYDQRASKPPPPKKKARRENADDESPDYDEEVVVRPKKWKRGWWEPFISPSKVEEVEASVKLLVLFEIMTQCEKRGEKLLLFSGSLFSLEMIEHFLVKQSGNNTARWTPGVDYFMITGATSGEERDEMCKSFNDPNNSEVRLFMISTKAGGMGITLNAANRAVIFDASWNPTHDIQSIFRIYRIGQDKPCFIYRLIASGTMEEKIYERQVTKQSVSRRVVDERQIARHYKDNELKELYELTADRQYQTDTRIADKDPVLREIVQKFGGLIGNYHEHDSLLQHKAEEELNIAERLDAWSDYDDGQADIGDIRHVVESMSADLFCIDNFKIELRKNFKELDEVAICALAKQLEPRVRDIMNAENFKDLMLQEGIECRYKEGESPDTPARSGNYSPSPTVARRQLAKGRAYQPASRGGFKPQPLKTWGALNGTGFGSPDV